jgi:hypothetical protein
MSEDLHPSQNRGLRELYAAVRHIESHWSRLATHLSDVDELGDGVLTAQALLAELGELTPEYHLYGTPAAQNVGVTLATTRGRVADRFLERNQALRLAVLDVQHVTTLLGYLGRVAEERGQHRLTEFCRRWERDLRAVEDEVRAVAIASGADPDRAIEPLDRSRFGRAAHQASYALGALGEWFDRRSAGDPATEPDDRPG